MKLKFWERKAEDRGAKYKAIRPPGSNGYVYIVREEKAGDCDLCTCFGSWDTAMENACLIAAAMNTYEKARKIGGPISRGLR